MFLVGITVRTVLKVSTEYAQYTEKLDKPPLSVKDFQKLKIPKPLSPAQISLLKPY